MLCAAILTVLHQMFTFLVIPALAHSKAANRTLFSMMTNTLTYYFSLTATVTFVRMLTGMQTAYLVVTASIFARTVVSVAVFVTVLTAITFLCTADASAHNIVITMRTFRMLTSPF